MLDRKTDVAKMPNKMDERARNCRMPRAVEREPIKLSHCPSSTDFLRINPYAARCKSIDRNRTIEPSIDRTFNANNTHTNTEIELQMCVCVCVCRACFAYCFCFCLTTKTIITSRTTTTTTGRHSCNWAHTHTLVH